MKDPPSWPGWGHYLIWKQAVRRWSRNTDVPAARHGDRVLSLLDWSMQTQLRHIAVEGAEGLDALIQALDTMAGQQEGDERKRAIRE
eukprot:8967093-Lingulodinium_polyedra.AAC.1